MIPKTPRGFRDVLPTEAAWRLSIKEAINERFKLWGYLPVETPAVELLDVLEMRPESCPTPRSGSSTAITTCSSCAPM